MQYFYIDKAIVKKGSNVVSIKSKQEVKPENERDTISCDPRRLNLFIKDININKTKKVSIPKISIITVCKNESSNISRTLESILKQTANNYELIICDGGSDDNTYDIVLDYKKKFDAKGIKCMCSSKTDGGIYSGMNSGIKKATGEYCIFMNGGDSFYSDDVISNASKKIRNNKRIDVLYGDCFVIDKYNSYVYHTNIKNIRFNECINHQSCFIKTKLLKKRKYSEKYRIASDYEYWLYLLDRKAIFCHTNLLIANFYYNGISTQLGKYQDEVDNINRIYRHLDYLSDVPKSQVHESYDYHLNNGDDNNLTLGWTSAYNYGFWAYDHISKFYFKLKKVDDLCLIINVSNSVGYHNKLYVNCNYVCDLLDHLGEHRIKIQSSFLREGSNEFTISTDDDMKPYCSIEKNTSDQRKLNLLVTKTAICYDKNLLKDDRVLCYNAYYGWSVDEGGYCWAIGRQTGFGHYLNVVNDITVKFEVKINIGYHNSFYVNDQYLCEIENRIGEHCYHVNKACLIEGINRFKIVTNDEVLPICDINKESSDTRKLNLFIGKISFINE